MEIRNIEIGLLDDPVNPSRDSIDPDGIAELMESIRQIGLRNPLSVRVVGDRYEVEAGHRRLLACREVGMETVPCIVDDGDEIYGRGVMAAENLARRDLNPVEEARILCELHEASGMSLSDLGKRVGVGAAVIRHRMNIMRYNEKLKKCLGDGTIGRGAAEYLSQIDDPDVLAMYLGYAVDGGCSAQVARQWVADWRKSRSVGADPLEGGISIADMTAYEPTYTTCGICGGPEDITGVNYVKVCRGCMARMRGRGDKAE